MILVKYEGVRASVGGRVGWLPGLNLFRSILELKGVMLNERSKLRKRGVTYAIRSRLLCLQAAQEAAGIISSA